MQHWIKWQKECIHCLTTWVIILGNRACYACRACVDSCGNRPWSPPVGPRSHECDDISRERLTLLLKFVCNSENWLHDHSDNFVLQNVNQPKVQIMLPVFFFFWKLGENYARDEKLCQKLCRHNLSKLMRRSATRSELCLRLTFSDVSWPGLTWKADMWIVSDCSLSRFVWIFLVQKWYRNTGLSTRRCRPVSDPCSRSHLLCHLRFVHTFSDI